MTKFLVTKNDHIKHKNGNGIIELVKREKVESFNDTILGLGNIDLKSEKTTTLSVIFDLEGFTSFCKQRDTQIAIPDFLSKFLKWIFIKVKESLTHEEYTEGFKLYSSFPFFCKFLGDGILFLWNTEEMSDVRIRNAVVAMWEICEKYRNEFLKNISSEIMYPPNKLRCGIALGEIYSVGNSNDYVGPCINMAARLQKLSNLTFCFSRLGINPALMTDNVSKMFLTKEVKIRGIGENELVCILKSEYDRLDKDEKLKFKEP